MNKIGKYTIDASEKRLGRVASEAAVLLMGKNNPRFRRHILSDTKVEIMNASRLTVTPQKLKSKEYTRYTGYPGGLRKQSMKQVIHKKGYRELLRRAVYGMLPRNKLRSRMMKNLIVKE